MTPLLDSSTSGAPVVAIRPLVILHYRPETFWRLLENWAEYRVTHRRPRRPFADGGSISHRYTPTEGNFVGGAEDYADFALALLAIPDVNERRATLLYWATGLRSVRRVGLAMQRDMNLAREWVWAGTAHMVERLCGLPPRDSVAECRLYRERLPMRRV